jgi:hypothetical protein
VHPFLRLDCFPEVAGTLCILMKYGLRIALLSNGSQAMLKAVELESLSELPSLLGLA